MAFPAPTAVDHAHGISVEPPLIGGGARTVRVLHVINGEHYAGAERVQDLLALELPSDGFEVGFACVKPDRFGRLRHARQAPLYEFRMRSRFDLSPVRHLARIIRQHDYALVHTHTPRAVLLGRVAAARAGVPLVHHLHSPTMVDTTHSWRNWLNAATERLSLARIAGVIAVSESLARYARRLGIGDERVRVVPNGVPARGPLAPRPTPNGEWTLAVVALFRPRKGVEVLLEALAQLRSEGWPVRLRAIGAFETADYQAHISWLTERLGLGDAVDWRGFTREVNLELNQADLFVLPSLFGEGMPMVVLEAMAAGLPVVASRVEGVPEVIRDGVDGLFVAPGDPEALARSIRQVLRGDVDWQQLRTSAHRRQADRYSARSMAAGVAGVYRQVLTARLSAAALPA